MRLSSAAPYLSAVAAVRSYSGYRWVVLALATLVQLGVSIPQQAPAALGPLLIHDLGLSRAQLGLLSSAIWGGMLLGTLPLGLMTDRFGERGVLSIGISALAVLLVVASFGHSFWVLFGVLLLASIGAASSSPGGTKAIASWFPPHRRGTAMGVRQTGVSFGGLVAAVVLPPVGVALGWPAAFRTAAVITLVTVLLFAPFYREAPLALTGARSRPPLREILARGNFWAATAYAFTLLGAMGAAVTYLSIFAHERLGLSVVAAGAVLGVMQVGGVVGRVAWGMLSDRVGRRGPVMLVVGAISVAVCAALALVRGPVPIPVIAVLAFLLGGSVMGWNALYITLVAESVPIQAAATAIGAGLTITFSAMFLITPIFGLLADLTGSYTIPWAAMAAWTGVGTIIGLAIRERRHGFVDTGAT
jgi:sugar phosphate permease